MSLGLRLGYLLSSYLLRHFLQTRVLSFSNPKPNKRNHHQSTLPDLQFPGNAQKHQRYQDSGDSLNCGWAPRLCWASSAQQQFETNYSCNLLHSYLRASSCYKFFYKDLMLLLNLKKVGVFNWRKYLLCSLTENKEHCIYDVALSTPIWSNNSWKTL